MTTPLIKLSNVQKTFRAESTLPVRALDGVSLRVAPGEWVYVVGGNGCGKSTLLSVMAGYLPFEAGEVQSESVDKDQIVFIEQGSTHNLVESMSIYENLALSQFRFQCMPSFRAYRRASLQQEFADVLSEMNLGLEHRLDDPVRLLSGGQRQAVVVAQILLTSPKLLLLDEFTSELDRRVAPGILARIKRLAQEQGTAIVAVTHDYHWIENTADRVLVMDDGRIIKELDAGREPLSPQLITEECYGKQL